MTRRAVKFPTGIATHLARVLAEQARPRGYAEQDKLTPWINLFQSGHVVKLEPPDASRLVSLMLAVCRPTGAAQAAELGAILKRLQGGR